VGLEQGCGLAQPKVQRARQNGAVALQTYEVGIWQASFLSFDHEVEKHSTI
jgi:hypothetical protein